MAEANVTPLPTSGNPPVVFVRDGAAFAGSRDVATFFEKRHEHVLDAIDNLLKTNITENSVMGKMLVEHVDPRPKENPGRPLRSFDLTRDGFALLAMGFTGPKALAFKLRYIEQFNAMEAALRAAPAALSTIPAPKSITDLRKLSLAILAISKAAGPVAARALLRQCGVDAPEPAVAASESSQRKRSAKPPVSAPTDPFRQQFLAKLQAFAATVSDTSMNEIAAGAFGIEPEQFSHADHLLAGAMLRSLGWVKYIANGPGLRKRWRRVPGNLAIGVVGRAIASASEAAPRQTSTIGHEDVFAVIKSAGATGIAKNRVTDRTRHLTSIERDAILSELAGAGRIAVKSVRQGHGGPRTQMLTAVKMR